MSVLSSLLSGFLAGTSAHAMYNITPSAPYAFAATALNCLYGVVGIVGNISNKTALGEAHGWILDLIQAIQYPLINIQFYIDSNRANPWLLAHGFALVPYLSGYIYHLVTRKGDDEMPGQYMTPLAELCFYGNTVTLLHLGFDEDNKLYFMIAAASFLHRYIPRLAPEHRDDIHNYSLSLISFLVGQAYVNDFKIDFDF